METNEDANEGVKESGTERRFKLVSNIRHQTGQMIGWFLLHNNEVKPI